MRSRLIVFEDEDVVFLEVFNKGYNLYEYYMKTSTSNDFEFIFGGEQKFTKWMLRKWLSFDINYWYKCEFLKEERLDL